jgi:hypothetical protein
MDRFAPRDNDPGVRGFADRQIRNRGRGGISRGGASNAIAAPLHPLIAAIPGGFADSRPIGTLGFAYNGNNLERSLIIPRRLLRDAQVLEIGFDLPDAAVSGDIGPAGDDPPLALCVTRIRVVAN